MISHRHWGAPLLAASLVVFITGCPEGTATTHEGNPPQADGKQTSPAAADGVAPKQPQDSPTRATGAAEKITIRAVDPAGLQKFVDENKGKVVLVDFWATWCLPCLKSFPHTVAMHHKYADKGFVAASMCMMDPNPETTGEALKNLEELNAEMPNFISALGGEEEAYEKFDLVNLPHYRLFGRDGKVIANLDNTDVDHPIDHTDVEREVRKALGLGEEAGENSP